MTTDPKNVVFAMEARVLRMLLRNASLFNSKDEARPILTGVRLNYENERGTVRLESTDSYVLLRQEIKLKGGGIDLDVLLSAPAVYDMTYMLGSGIDPKDGVSLTVDHNKTELLYTTKKGRWETGRGEFPNTSGLLDSWAPGSTDAFIGLDADFLRKICALRTMPGKMVGAAHAAAPLRLAVGSGGTVGPLRFEIGGTSHDDLRLTGLIMPIRSA